MKKLLFLLMGAFSVIALNAQSRETRKLSHFNEIDVGSAIEVILTKGTDEKAVVSVTGTDAENVITEVSGSELKIHMRSGNYRHVEATVNVTYTELKGINISSAARLTADEPIESEKMEIDVSSAGKGDVNLNVKSLEADVSSAGNLSVKGQTIKQEVEVSSAGGYNGEDLQCEEAEVSVSSAGNARINATKDLTAEASSGGSIKYKGNPVKEYTTENSGGSVRKLE